MTIDKTTTRRAKPERQQVPRLGIMTAVFLATSLAAPVQAAVTVPNVPLQSGSGVPPNIMFILDDSGSMHGEITPDEFIPTVALVGYVFPRASSVYGGGDYDNYVVTFNDSNGFARAVRSVHFNKSYYDPAVTYRPWVRADGTSFPNASTSAAYHNPQNTGAGSRDLTVENSESAIWLTCSAVNNCAQVTEVRDFFPAVYYTYNGSNSSSVLDFNTANYTKVEITSDDAPFTGEGRANRSDCVAGSCTYEQEIQNFANWYTYYRSRVSASRAGIGRAFSPLGEGTDAAGAPRIGYATINAGSSTVDNVSSPGTIVRGVRPFTGTARTNWFDSLYSGTIPNEGTPLRRALDDAGVYFSREDERGPWSSTPGQAGGNLLACRQSYSILMTDGYWTNNNASRARTSDARLDVDSTNGPTIQGPGTRTYSYVAASPFRDNRGNTLADVAMYYWKRDIAPNIPNRVPTSPQNPAFWQHMVTFGVGLGVSGTIAPKDAFDAIDSSGSITWPNPFDSQAAKIDDLLHAAVNSRGGFFSAADPETFSRELARVLSSIIERTASGSNVAANSVALRDETRIFQANYVGGQWTGDLLSYPITASGVSATPSWRTSDPGKIPAAADREANVFTRVGATTGTFHELRGTALGEESGFSVADYLLGDASGERRNGGPFRNRQGVLGDIVHSSPAFVAESNPAMLYVGANDGMLHAFNATNGEELFAYVPRALSNDRLKALSSPDYLHQYYVDGPVAVSNKVQGAGKNYLVGMLGRGGRGLFGLDVTNPSAFAAASALWDIDASVGTNNPTGWTADARSDMGLMVNPAVIALSNLNSGSGNNATARPIAVVGNGLPVTGSSGRAALYFIDPATGELIRHIRLGATETGNGVTSIRAWDDDGDGRIDFVYAADFKGNIWKIDIDFTSAGNWGVADGGGTGNARRSSGGNPLIATGQPITGGIQVAMNFVGNSLERWVFFGTGKYIEQGDTTSTTQQRWFGVKDTGTQVTALSQLTQRQLIASGTINNRPVRAFEPNAPLPLNSRGWYINLQVPATGQTSPPSERMIGDPLMVGRILVAPSILPNNDPCEAGGTGYLNAIDAFTGTSVQAGFFDVNGNSSFDDDRLANPNQPGTTVPVGSVDVGVFMPSSPTVVENLLVVGGSRGTTGSVGINNPLIKGRISWREIVGD